MAKQETDKAAADAGAPAGKNGKLVPIIALVVGVAVGGGGAAGYFLTRPPADGQQAAPEPEPEEEGEPAAPEFVDISRLAVPMIGEDGKLAGYMNLDIKVEVAAADLEFAKSRVPMIRHAVNQALSTTSIADAKNPQLLDYKRAEEVLMNAINTALGKKTVLSVQIVGAIPI